MAANGRFTFEDLYAGQSPNYYRRPFLPKPKSITTTSILPILDIPPTTTTVVPTSYPAKLVSSTEVESNIKLNKVADVIPFTYFYWILVVLAVLLILTLIIVFIFYCRAFVKNYRAHRRSSNFYQRRTINSRIYTSKIYQPPAKPVAVPASAPTPVPPSPPLPRILPTPPCPSQPLKCLDNQLYRHDSDTTNSPPVVRHDVFLKEPLSTFTSSTTNLSAVSHPRLSICSSDPPLKVERSYESQRASMIFNDEPKTDSLIFDIN